jgi:hypothetical protein
VHQKGGGGGGGGTNRKAMRNDIQLLSSTALPRNSDGYKENRYFLKTYLFVLNEMKPQSDEIALAAHSRNNPTDVHPTHEPFQLILPRSALVQLCERFCYYCFPLLSFGMFFSESSTDFLFRLYCKVFCQNLANLRLVNEAVFLHSRKCFVQQHMAGR